MGANRTTGDVAKNSGSYHRPPNGGVVSPTQQPTGVVDSTNPDSVYKNVVSPDTLEADYVPNGNVYERPDFFIPAPPESVFIQSVPYPVFFEDDMNIDSQVMGGAQFPFVDSLDVDAPILSGTLSTLLLSYPIPAEDMSISSEVLSGTLPTLLFSYTIPSEDLDLSSEILSGALITVLLYYTNWPSEDMVISSIILGGTLD